MATVPATATYPAMLITAAGNAMGAVKMAPLAAAKAIPIFLNFLKKLGVGSVNRFCMFRFL